MKKKKTEKKVIIEAEEPAQPYGLESGKNELRIFNSFEEQEDEMRKYSASLSPEQRMEKLHELICISFGLTPEKLKNPGLSNKIYIRPLDGFIV